MIVCYLVFFVSAYIVWKFQKCYKKKLNTTFSCIISKMFVSLFQRNIAMAFDKILENNTLWAVRSTERPAIRSGWSSISGMILSGYGISMQEREHTLKELRKMEQVRNLLIEQGAIDADGFEDYLTETK